jgi:thiazole/oxazole-forming peptide maturase SagD family component
MVLMPGSANFWVENKMSNFLFGKRLLAPAATLVQEKLIALAAASLDHETYVDTLLGLYFDREVEAARCQRFIIFDFYRIVLYENSAESEGPKVDSVIRYLLDDYLLDPQILSSYGKECFHFFHSMDSLDILPLLWSANQPGLATTLDLSTGEIRKTQAIKHPECEPARIVKLNPDDLRAVNNPLVLTDRYTGPHLRTHSPPDLYDLVSPEVGVIRYENTIMGQLSFPTAIAKLATGHKGQYFCSGRSRYISDAQITARCEAVERHLTSFRDPDIPLIYNRYQDLRDIAINPQLLCFNYPKPDPTNRRVPYNDQLCMYWCWAQDVRSGKAYLVPAQEVWFNTALLPNEHLCSWTTTNGCALGSSVEEAALFAILELIERDAFLITWYLRRPCQKIDSQSIGVEEFRLLWLRARSAYPNYSLQLFNITTDVAIPAVMCIAVKQSGKGPKLMLTAACRLHCHEAAICAVKDLAGMPDTNSYNADRTRKFLEHPEDISVPEDHASFYAAEENFQRLLFLNVDAHQTLAAADVDGCSWFSHQVRYNLKAILDQIVDHLDSQGILVLLKDLTHHEFRRRGLFCLRAIIPTLYPMWFGYYGARFIMTDRLQRLAERFHGRPIEDESKINLDVHPFD